MSSYIHMMNNRLGVSIQEECYLSVLIGEPWGESRSMAAAECLDTALAIGRRLARQALREGRTCTWDVLEPQPDPENRVRTIRAVRTVVSPPVAQDQPSGLRWTWAIRCSPSFPGRGARG